MNWAELAGVLVGLVLTISIFSYFLGDNWLFRLAIHILIGVTSGLFVVILWYNLLWPKLVQPFMEGMPDQYLFLLVTAFSALFFLAKIIPRFSFLSIPIMAVLVGVGAAVAVGGSLLGTIFPLVTSQVSSFDFLNSSLLTGVTIIKLANSFILLIGTISTMLYFLYSAPRQPVPRRWLARVASIGKLFLAVTFGALFAGVLAFALAALMERLDFFLQFLQRFIGGAF